jgi:hypothetical protein
MKIFTSVLIFLIAFGAAMVLVALFFIYRFIQRIKRQIIGDIDDEEAFRRMSDRRYRAKQHVEFDKDYFKSKNTTSGDGAKRQQQTKQRTTTTTADGVTIIDERSQTETKRKIFEADEGEYVEYTEE